MGTREILWGDDGNYRPRYEKSATAFVAVQRALQARRPLEGREEDFLDLCAVVAAVEPSTFTTVWKDPFCYFWARRAFELVRLCLKKNSDAPYDLRQYCVAIGAATLLDALESHLQEFKRIVIALDILTGATRKFKRPLETGLPLSVPGTVYSIFGCGRIEIRGVVDGTLEATRAGRTLRLRPDATALVADLPRLVTRPEIRFGDAAIRLKPETFLLPGVAPAAALDDVAEAYQRQQAPLIEKALLLVEKHQPDTLRQIAELIGVIGVKPPTSGDYNNVTISDLPAAFIVSAYPDPYWIADSLIHEFFHNRMFFIAEEDAILADAEPDEDPDNPGVYYSPWRTDLRPLTGILHAQYVHIGVCRFWLSVWQSGETEGPRRAYAQAQAFRWMCALKIGAHQLRVRARFTKLGEAVFNELQRETQSLWTLGSTLGLSPNAPAMMIRRDGAFVERIDEADGRPLSIIETIRRHQEDYDTHRQCADLNAIINLSSL